MSYPRKWLTSSIAGGVALGLVVGFSVKAVSGDDDDSKTNVDTGTTVVAVVDTSAVTTSTLPPTAVVPPETTVAPPRHHRARCPARLRGHAPSGHDAAPAPEADDHAASAPAASADRGSDHAVRHAAADPSRELRRAAQCAARGAKPVERSRSAGQRRAATRSYRLSSSAMR